MPEDFELDALQLAIGEARAGWSASLTSMLQLEPEDRRLRLGANIDETNLAALREQPTPDVVQLASLAILDPAARDQQDSVEIARRIVTATGELQDLTAKVVGTRIIPLPLWWWLVDWRNRFGLDAVTPVRDQGPCGSCVAFGTIAALESMLIVERQITLELSEAELLFCGGGSCGGWWPTSAVSYLANRGVAQAGCFPYQPINMACNPCPRRDEEAIKITANTVVFDVGQRKQYLGWVGPMIAVFAVYDDFFAYTGGVYTHLTGGLAGYHCVEVIGYDDLGGFWICKNSWGAGWGEAGFFCIAYGQCEIDSTFPFWGVSGTEFWK
jgi:C1A family cysteine protease